MVIVFSYNRETMLKEALKPLDGIEHLVIDDGSSFDLEFCKYLQTDHQGKQGFWRLWNLALYECLNTDHDFFMFMPDDFTNIDIDRIKELHDRFKTTPYTYNIINDGRKNCWRISDNVQIDEDTEDCGFVDCGFFCNREALELLRWTIEPIPASRFNKPNISSGVGQQLTNRLAALRIPMYRPFKSLAYHGDHESQMHGDERKQNPLLSK